MILEPCKVDKVPKWQHWVKSADLCTKSKGKSIQINTRTSPAGHGGAEVESYFPNLILPNQFYPNFISPLKFSYSAPKSEFQETHLTSSQNVLTTSDQLSMHPGTISGRQNEPNCNFRTSIFLILVVSQIGNDPGSPTCRGSTRIQN